MHDNIKFTLNLVIRRLCSERAEECFAITEKKAIEEYGAIADDDSISEQEKDKFFEDFAVEAFTSKRFQEKELGHA